MEQKSGYDRPELVVFVSHFCELHGPSMLMCTRSLDHLPPSMKYVADAEDVRNSSEYDLGVQQPRSTAESRRNGIVPNANIADQGSKIAGENRNGINIREPSDDSSLVRNSPSSLKNIKGEGHHKSPNPDSLLSRDGDMPGSSLATPLVGQSTAKDKLFWSPTESAETKKEKDTEGQCCSSIGDLLLVTQAVDGNGNSRHYVSSKQAPPSLYSRLRRACLRSLSVEVAAGGGAVLFSDGEKERTHALSLVFRISDVHARGEKRTLSLVILLTGPDGLSRDSLLSHWGVLVPLMQRIASEWVYRARRKYARSSSTMQTRSRYASSSLLSLSSKKTEPRREQQPINILQDPSSFSSLFGFKGLGLWHRLHSSLSFLLLSFEQRLESWKLLFRSVGGFRGVNGSGKKEDKNIPAKTSTQIKCSHCEIIEEIADFLASLLPERCGEVMKNSDIYRNVYDCNILCLSLETKLPRHAIPPNYLIMYVLCDGEQRRSVGKMRGGVSLDYDCAPRVAVTLPESKIRGRDRLSTEDVILHAAVGQGAAWDFTREGMVLPALPGPEADSYFSLPALGRVASHGPIGVKPNIEPTRVKTKEKTSHIAAYANHTFEIVGAGSLTTIVPALANVITDGNLSSSAVRTLINAIKSKWIDRAVTFFHYSRKSHADEWRRLSRILKVLGAIRGDLPVLRFWSTGMRLDIGNDNTEVFSIQ